ncbi:MAG: hypothetical protein ACKV2T_19905 [Kofleriaceae bacterium]
MRVLASIVCCACGRVGFDASVDSGSTDSGNTDTPVVERAVLLANSINSVTNLYRLDLDTATTIELGPLGPIAVTGLTWTDAGELWGVRFDGELIHITVAPFGATVLGVVPSMLIGVENTPSGLLGVAEVTNEASLITPDPPFTSAPLGIVQTPGGAALAIAGGGFARDETTTYMWTNGTDAGLFAIQGGVATRLLTPSRSDFLTGITFVGDELFAVSRTTNELLVIDRGNGAFTQTMTLDLMIGSSALAPVAP